MELFILYFMGCWSKFVKMYFCPLRLSLSLQKVKINEIPLYKAFHLGLHCLSKFPSTAIQKELTAILRPVSVVLLISETFFISSRIDVFSELHRLNSSVTGFLISMKLFCSFCLSASCWPLIADIIMLIC